MAQIETTSLAESYYKRMVHRWADAEGRVITESGETDVHLEDDFALALLTAYRVVAQGEKNYTATSTDLEEAKLLTNQLCNDQIGLPMKKWDALEQFLIGPDY